MKTLLVRLIAMLSFAFILVSGNAIASTELVMQKVSDAEVIQLASGSHNPCGHGDHGKKASKGHGNPCNPCGEAHNACNPCGANPCAANPCGQAALEEGRIIIAGHHEAGENPCAADNPCSKNPCADNPCAKNPCAANPCNPCGKGH